MSKNKWDKNIFAQSESESRKGLHLLYTKYFQCPYCWDKRDRYKGLFRPVYIVSSLIRNKNKIHMRVKVSLNTKSVRFGKSYSV